MGKNRANSFIIVKCIVSYEDKVLLLRRGKTAPRRPGQWDFPGGYVDNGESPDEAMLRELKEESGITASVKIFHTDSQIRDDHQVVFLYYTTDVRTDDVKISWEHDQFKWVPLDEAIKLNTYSYQNRALKQLANQ